MNIKKKKKNTITVILTNGHLRRDLMKRIFDIAEEHDLQIYLSNEANLRITGMADEKREVIKQLLTEEGCIFKQSGCFPKPRTCAGKKFCTKGHTDTHALSHRIFTRFSGRTIKPKLKIAVAGCIRGCSNPKLADIGIIANAKGGFDIFAGGKGGGQPRIAVQIAKNSSEEELTAIIESLLDYHGAKTEKRQRLCSLLMEPDFPYPPL